MTLRILIAGDHNPTRDPAKREAHSRAALERARRLTADAAVPMFEQAYGALVDREEPAEDGA